MKYLSSSIFYSKNIVFFWQFTWLMRRISLDRYEAALDPWMTSLWGMLNKINPKFFPNGPDYIIPSKQSVGQPKFHITYHVMAKTNSQFSCNSGNLPVWISLLCIATTSPYFKFVLFFKQLMITTVLWLYLCSNFGLTLLVIYAAFAYSYDQDNIPSLFKFISFVFKCICF